MKLKLKILIFLVILTICLVFYNTNFNSNKLPLCYGSECMLDYMQIEYNIENHRICEDFKGELLGIIIITSYVAHDELRTAHRAAITQNTLQSMGFIRVFLLAEQPSNERFISYDQITQEQEEFGDIIQGNFIENYKNLTYKHIMGLKWVSERCTKARFLVKIDDDIVYNIYGLNNYLELLRENEYQNQYLLNGFLLSNKKPIRSIKSKWYVTNEEYGKNIYPDYLSGWLYISTPKTAQKLVQQSKSIKQFWIDDIYVTGILAEAIGIKFVKLNKWFSANSQYLDCCIKDAIENRLKCDYNVGPNGGDNELIIEFTRAMEICSVEEDCNSRSYENSLTNTCIGTIKDIVKDHGIPFIKNIKL